ncbi:hypothetical protein [Pseudoalteromonas umbrosa]|uniref:hypothetical protein n=1 Tax=Pseudoalteromonas umbrosa TaxID=3048489 RepID=UPI0024C262B6|nr:hypothetical protein [Pseudoalteromonas sp. B95]MDK1290624.1 hypothetical protein [Pseudoalteromonas sp. B95]
MKRNKYKLLKLNSLLLQASLVFIGSLALSEPSSQEGRYVEVINNSVILCAPFPQCKDQSRDLNQEHKSV